MIKVKGAGPFKTVIDENYIGRFICYVILKLINDADYFGVIE